MSEHSKQQRAAMDAHVWQPIINAWRDLADDEETTLILTDIVPNGFAHPAKSAVASQKCSTNWVWRRV